nr:aminoglycoside phosphotransferase family protein [Kofleriaceae bacterium]
MTATPATPSRELRAWLADTVGAGARVVRCRRLTGGITSHVHLVTVERRGRRDAYVLRSWDDPLPPYARGAVPLEAAILAALATADIPAPRLVASLDAAPGPALVMTRVPGRVHLMPRDRDAWLRQMAAMLARIHALDVAAPAYEAWLDVARLAPPADSARPELWRDAIALVSSPPPATAPVFVHHDYQHFNLLWTRDRLTGVVDWTYAARGPAASDAGHCRLNLALLFSPELAERFRELYEADAGRRVDPWWDVRALLAFGPAWRQFLPLQVDGRAPLDTAGMLTRVEAVLEGALRRV